MLKNKTKKLFSLILIIAIVGIFSISLATEGDIMPISEENENQIQGEVTSEDEEEGTATITDTSNWINSDAYLYDDNILINKVVDGNVFAIGKTVTVTGEVGGDLFVFADKVIIDEGYIYSSIFAIANEIEVNGVVYDLYAMAKEVTIGEKGYVYRDIRATADTINIDGKVRRDAHLSVGTLNIAPDNGTIINGNLEYASAKEAFIPEGTVAGESNFIKEEITTTQSVQSTILSYIGDLAKALIYALIVILLATWLAPKFTEKLSKSKGSDIAISLAVGVLACVVTFIVSFVLLFTVLGIPLSCAFVVIILLLLSISKAIVAMTISGIITKKAKIEGKMKFILITLLAVFVIWAIGQIPFSIGFIFKMLVGAVGVGLVLTNIVNRKSKEIVGENE